MAHDASRVKIQFPDMDYDGDGAVDSTSAFFACVFSGPDWSGFTKTAVNTTCSNATLDAWGNLIKTYRGGRIIDQGTITISVDWSPIDADGGKVYGAFASTVSGNFLVQLPPEAGETTGAFLTIPGEIEQFTPMGKVLAEGDEARWAASIVIRISGAITFAAAS